MPLIGYTTKCMAWPAMVLHIETTLGAYTIDISRPREQTNMPVSGTRVHAVDSCCMELQRRTTLPTAQHLSPISEQPPIPEPILQSLSCSPEAATPDESS